MHNIIHYCRYTSYNLSTDVITVDCNGTESNLNDCVIEMNSVTEKCSEIAYLECGQLHHGHVHYCKCFPIFSLIPTEPGDFQGK